MDWRELYSAARLETNPRHLLTLIYETETAMFNRAQQLGMEPDAEAEKFELKEAANGLLKLKIERLGWPIPGNGQDRENWRET